MRYLTLKCVLVLAGVELIFLTVAALGPCFGFVLETVLVTQGWFGYPLVVVTQSQGLFCSSPHPTSEGAGSAWGWDTVRTAVPN